MRRTLLQVVGQYRGRGATIDDILDGVNALNKSDKRDDYVRCLTEDGF